MNREFQPCGACAKFLPDASLRKDEEGPGYCEGYERSAHSQDIASPCALFAERDSWATRKAQQPPCWD